LLAFENIVLCIPEYILEDLRALSLSLSLSLFGFSWLPISDCFVFFFVVVLLLL